jgi:general secretion pathway protein M
MMTGKLATVLTRFPAGATVLYAGTIVALGASIAFQLGDIAARRDAVASAADLLARLEGRNAGTSYALASGTANVAGSPFLEGTSVTVAGAALLQRVAGAVTKVGGNVLSSQVDVQGPQSKQGFVAVTASCEIDQPALQQLLYDPEAGMPFLFVDQLVVQAPAAGASNRDAGARLRVLISVSAQWQEDK